MNVFEAVKQNVTTRQAAELYGIPVSRNGMAVCPFHNDKNPSMKLDRRFHCFGCQADGDAVDFVSRLFQLPSKEAAIKLADDFGLPMTTGRSRPSSPISGNLPRSRNTGRKKCTATRSYANTSTFSRNGNSSMPHKLQRMTCIRSLWKPCKGNPTQSICWIVFWTDRRKNAGSL